MNRHIIEMAKKLRTEHMAWMLPLCFSFIMGVLFTDYMYRDIPKVQLYTQKSNTELLIQQKLLQCQGLANTIVNYDAQIIGATNDLLYSQRPIRNIPQYSDSLQDIYNLQDRRQPFLNSINRLVDTVARASI